MAIVLNAKWGERFHTASLEVRRKDLTADYREFVFRCALSICGEPESAEDVSQEVLLILHAQERKLSQVASPEAWIRKVTVRVALKTMKSRSGASSPSAAERSTDETQRKLEVLDVLHRMKPEDRALLGMALGQGLSYREIAEALGIPEGTVASRLNAAKKEFQRRWES